MQLLAPRPDPVNFSKPTKRSPASSLKARVFQRQTEQQSQLYLISRQRAVSLEDMDDFAAPVKTAILKVPQGEKKGSAEPVDPLLGVRSAPKECGEASFGPLKSPPNQDIQHEKLSSNVDTSAHSSNHASSTAGDVSGDESAGKDSFQGDHDVEQTSELNKKRAVDPQEDEEVLAKKRKMNIIYSRRKREKKKMQVEALQNKSVQLTVENEKLQRDGIRLERLLQQAKLMVAQVESLPSQVMNPAVAALPPRLDPSVSLLRGLAPSGLGPSLAGMRVGLPNLSDSLALLNRLRANQSAMAAESSIRQWPNLTAMGSSGGFGMPSGDTVADILNSRMLVQQLALQQEQKRKALIEASLQRDALQRVALLQQARSNLLPTGLPQVPASLQVQQQQSGNDPVTSLLISRLLAQQKQKPPPSQS